MICQNISQECQIECQNACQIKRWWNDTLNRGSTILLHGKYFLGYFLVYVLTFFLAFHVAFFVTSIVTSIRTLPVRNYARIVCQNKQEIERQK